MLRPGLTRRQSAEERFTRFAGEAGIPLLRIGLGVVYLWFGVLKLFPGGSPAQDLVERTVSALTFEIIHGDLARVSRRDHRNRYRTGSAELPCSTSGRGPARRTRRDGVDTSGALPRRDVVRSVAGVIRSAVHPEEPGDRRRRGGHRLIASTDAVTGSRSIPQVERLPLLYGQPLGVIAVGGSFAPLAHPAFRWLLLGRTTTMIGNAMAPIALAFAVLDLTSSVAVAGHRRRRAVTDERGVPAVGRRGRRPDAAPGGAHRVLHGLRGQPGADRLPGDLGYGVGAAVRRARRGQRHVERVRVPRVRRPGAADGSGRPTAAGQRVAAPRPELRAHRRCGARRNADRVRRSGVGPRRRRDVVRVGRPVFPLRAGARGAGRRRAQSRGCWPSSGSAGPSSCPAPGCGSWSWPSRSSTPRSPPG